MFLHSVPAGSQTDDAFRHQQACGGDDAEDVVQAELAVFVLGLQLLLDRGALDGNQLVDGQALRVLVHGGEGVDEVDVVVDGLAHAEDAARAGLDAGVVDVLDCLETVVVGPGGDDVLVVGPGRVDVVVVGGQAGVLEGLCLLLVDHAEGDARLHLELRVDLPDHVGDLTQGALAALHVSPRGAHAEPRRVVLLGDLGLFVHRVEVQQLRRLEPRVVVARLRAVLAVLRAPARLDRQERAQLHLCRVVVLAVLDLCVEHEVVERHAEQRCDLVPCPAGDGCLCRQGQVQHLCRAAAAAAADLPVGGVGSQCSSERVGAG